LGNPVFELAIDNGLININDFHQKPHKVVAATEDGKQVKFSVLSEVYEAYSTFLRRCEEYYHNFYVPPNDLESVGGHVQYEVDLYLESIDSADRRLRQLIFDCLLKRETCITGCHSMDEIDLIELGSYKELQGRASSLELTKRFYRATNNLQVGIS
jgi:spermine oxidase